MKLAKELEAQVLTAKSYSKLDKVTKLAASFEKFTLRHVPHEQNERADLLSKLASTQKVETIGRSFTKKSPSRPLRVEYAMQKQDKHGWTHSSNTLDKDTILEDTEAVKRLKQEVSKYTLVGEHLYRRDFSFLLLNCLYAKEVEYVMREVHEGVCESHIRGHALASKITKAGYY
ncbi:hypothetical protein CR513_44903, partial [Mucuna pruriens]